MDASVCIEEGLGFSVLGGGHENGVRVVGINDHDIVLSSFRGNGEATCKIRMNLIACFVNCEVAQVGSFAVLGWDGKRIVKEFLEEIFCGLLLGIVLGGIEVLGFVGEMSFDGCLGHGCVFLE